MLDLTTIFIGIISALFVFTSVILSKLSFDEVAYKSNLKLGGVIGVVILSSTVALFFQYYIALIIILFFAAIIHSTFNTYYAHRSLSYVLMYVLLFIQPLFVSLIAILEFFNLSFNKNLKIRFELLLFCGFVVSLLIVFFSS